MEVGEGAILDILINFILIEVVLVLVSTSKVQHRVSNWLACKTKIFKLLLKNKSKSFLNNFSCKGLLFLPSFFKKFLSCINPLKGANPVPGPIIMTGVLALNGRRN